ncbi:homoserine O-succinyltransferase [Hyphococcus flavus]|uniref:Homoserine O-succinyltransferase n=1 Tax=Hyphococcus flavus TaxID=1866326 RepID=A0AAE9ZAR8_9PROT|nr:homoserine O-succinyltransferase [Hyphococcus flavus]WDI30848.1 homoserine O-succinyltransferase [Hyphococcus flavus]
MASAQIETEETVLRKTVLYSEVSIFLPGDIELDSGETLSKPELSVRIYGDLTQPVVAAAGGVSSGRIIADTSEDRGWWQEFVSAGGAINLDEYCVIGFDFLPNPGEAARTISTADQARAFAHALDIIGVEKLYAFAGASYGGMVGLKFAELFPERIEKLIAISAPDRPHPAATAQRGVQRRIIQFANDCGRPEEGVSLARQLAMVSYRTPEEFEQRFASNAYGEAAGAPYDICEYLIARGEAYDVSAERYLTLSDSIDRHRADPAKIKADTLVIAATSDRLSPPADLKRLAGVIDAARFVEIPSLFGHDAFLKEPGAIGPHIKEFLKGAKS